MSTVALARLEAALRSAADAVAELAREAANDGAKAPPQRAPRPPAPLPAREPSDIDCARALRALGRVGYRVQE